jgi:hypothetical protein
LYQKDRLVCQLDEETLSVTTFFCQGVGSLEGCTRQGCNINTAAFISIIISGCLGVWEVGGSLQEESDLFYFGIFFAGGFAVVNGV